ncbi:hypothetical protein H849_11421 [Prescottella equi NBRC 101255 = C 7]|nr:hypothetical protein H849_11421 [Prescottella equi NBRC 101255 = C 7]
MIDTGRCLLTWLYVEPEVVRRVQWASPDLECASSLVCRPDRVDSVQG